jgi:ABC-type transport system involved in multi-copper enzyme maturation permease subunit
MDSNPASRRSAAMWVARHKSFAAGLVFGSLAAFLTWRFAEIFFSAPVNPFMRAVYSLVQAIVLPGAISAFFIERSSGVSHLWQAVLINFVFWFAFAWIVGVLLGTLRKQWRTLLTQLPR